MFRKIKLKNGLRIITIPMKNTQAVSVLVLAGAGSKYETKQNNGISHFLEHMFFKGTKNKPDKMEIAEILDKVGGMYNAFTSKEITGYWAKVDSKHFDLALDWVSDIFLNSKIEEKEINNERGVIIEELNMYLDTPMMHIQDLWEELLYGDQPAGWSIIGERKNILNLGRKQFLKYLKNHYTAKNTIVCVAGNINAETAQNKIKKYFENINTGQPKPKIKVEEKQTKPQCLIHYKETDQTHLMLGARGYHLFHPKKYAQLVLSVILGGFMSSRLFMKIREEQGLAYYIRTTNEKFTDTGYLVTSAGIRNTKVEQAITAILEEYKIMKEKKISEQELQKAKDYLKGTLSLSLELSDSRASFFAMQELLGEKILTPKEQCQKINQVTQDDVLEVARDIFQLKNLNLALIGPFKNKIKFEELLKL
jgi:predicted Zn-dependent peptidase